MKLWKSFDIEIFNLSNSKHEFRFNLDDSFFEMFPHGLLTKGKANAEIILDKSETFINAYFKIEGAVELICDRSLENFDNPFEVDEHIIFKFGEEEKELSDDIIIISKNAQRINVAQYIYEFIGLTVPMKKIHPKYKDEDDDDLDVEGKLVYTSGPDTADDEPDKDNDAPVDPRWEILKRLKDN